MTVAPRRGSMRRAGAAALSAMLAAALSAPACAQSATQSAAAIPANQLVARPGLSVARVEGVDFAYRLLVGPSLLQDENFYLLTLLEQVPAANQALRAEPELETIRRGVVARVKATVAACEAMRVQEVKPPEGSAAVCSPQAMRLTDAERQQSAAAMGRLYDRSPAVGRLVTEHMRPSGRFHRDAGLDDRALLVKAWEDAMEGVDRIIRVYGLGEKPRYADIDSVIYDPNSGYYRSVMRLSIWETGRKADKATTLFRPALDHALALMEINRRVDAVRQLKLQETTNAATFAWLARGVRWDDYRYAAIIVPGWSPEIAYEPLNPGRKVALRYAAEQFREGLAPVVIVSGARLRPIGTEWTEAYEMKVFLVEEQGIPADRILINPISRHTHTEIRDNGRMLFRTGAPLGKKSIYVSESISPLAQGENRSIRDFGYIPWTQFERRDFITLELIPTLKDLHREATDPMNP